MSDVEKKIGYIGARLREKSTYGGLAVLIGMLLPVLTGYFPALAHTSTDSIVRAISDIGIGVGLMIGIALPERTVRMLAVAFLSGALLALVIAAPASAASLPQAATPTVAPLSYNYPTTTCGPYYGLNTMGLTAAVNGATVGTQFVQGAIGLTLGYTCPIGPGYWFADGDFDFANLNGSANGLSLTGPAKFAQRFGFGAPVDLLISMIPGLSSLQNAVPSLIPLPSGITVNTSSPYIFGAIHEDDVGGQIGLANFKQFLISAGFGIGNKTRLSNGVVFDPYAEYILPSSQICLGAAGCFKKGSEALVGMKLEF